MVDLVSLRDCPPGLFRFGETIGFKTEYRGMETVGPIEVPGDQVRWIVGNHSDAYVVESGESFWGGAPNRDARDALLVEPVDLASLPCKSGEGAGESGYKAHFERMQDMMRRYIEPITYVASFPTDSTKHAREFEEPGPHDSSTNSESKRRRMDRAFISDMIHMMDGPEQRALALTPDATQTREAEAERVLAAFNGGMVQVPDTNNPRGYVTYYRPLDAMRAALNARGGA